MNHREGVRVPTDLQVIVHRSNRDPIRARLRNVSMSGAGIECAGGAGIHPMEKVDLCVELPRSESLEPARIAGFVARCSSDWLGVMFMREAPRLPRRLRDASVHGRRGTRAFPAGAYSLDLS